MKLIDYLLEDEERRRVCVFLLLLGLCLAELYYEVLFAQGILGCQNTADAIALTSVAGYRNCLLARLMFNVLQYIDTDLFVISVIIHTVSVRNILIVLLTWAYLEARPRDRHHDSHRLTLFILIIVFFIKSGLFVTAAIKAFTSGDTAQGLYWLHNGAFFIKYGGIAAMIIIMTALVSAVWHGFLENHISG